MNTVCCLSWQILFFFSSYSDEKNKSALCVFTSGEMKQVFRSGIFYDPTVKGEWTAFPMEDIPQGSVRIGEVCHSSCVFAICGTLVDLRGTSANLADNKVKF